MSPRFHPLVLVDELFQSPPRRGGGLRIELLSTTASGRTPSLRVVVTTVAGSREYCVVINARWRRELRQAVERWCELCDAHEHGSTAEVE